MDTPDCVRCHEEFPIQKKGKGWQMGTLKPLREAPKGIQAQFSHVGAIYDLWLCGNCYFDLTD
jgi:hypothetical protein